MNIFPRVHSSLGAGVVLQPVKLPSVMGKQSKMVQLLGSLSPTWETRTLFLTLAWASPNHRSWLEGINELMGDLFLLLVFQIYEMYFKN